MGFGVGPVKVIQLHSIIHRAASNGSIMEIKNALGQGIGVNTCDMDGYTPLHWGIE